MDKAPFEQQIVEQCLREGRELPEAIRNKPELWAGSELWWDGFHSLSSDRQMTKEWMGPIPWSSMDQYCRAYTIEGDQREEFFYHVTRLDKTFLEWATRKRQAANAAAPPKGRRR